MHRILTCFSLTVLLLILASARLFAFDAVSGNATQKKNQFTLTIDRAMVGATVHVYYGNNARLLSQPLRKRKMIIDFELASVGEYTISIEKGDTTLTYHYLKK